jgi:hypothetical protein
MLPRARHSLASCSFGAVTALIVALVVLPGVARAATAAASPIPRLVLPGISTVHAGAKIEIRWTVPPASIEELELRLSLDGGRQYTLRVSPELDPRAGRFVWRVPNLASGEARLRLRFNRDGQEIDGEPSEPFRIVAEAGEEAELLQVNEGTWWTGVRELDLPGAGNCFAPVGEKLTSSTDGVVQGPAPRTTSNDPLILLHGPGSSRVPGPDHSPAPRPGSPPRFVPARN